MAVTTPNVPGIEGLAELASRYINVESLLGSLRQHLAST